MLATRYTYLLSVSRPWKFEHIAIGFLSLLLRDDQQLPPAAVIFFVKSLNHDTLYVRKVGCVQFICPNFHHVHKAYCIATTASELGGKKSVAN